MSEQHAAAAKKASRVLAASTRAEERSTNILAVDSQFHHFYKDNTTKFCIAVPLPRELCLQQAATARSAHSAKKLQKGGRGSGSPSSKEQRWELKICVPLLSGRAGVSSTASALQEPRALFTITPTGSRSAGKMSLLPFPPMLQFLSPL